MTSGKTWPCLLVCQCRDGREVEVVAKFSAGCERGIGGLVAEAIGAMLAADLGLPVPEPLLIEFDAGFVNLVASVDGAVAERLGRSASVAFGSAKLPTGFVSPPVGKAIPASLLTEAAEILAFDALIQNPDRRPENPNLLLNGRDLAIFDHELAFMTDGIIGWRPPWERDGLEDYVRRPGHVFFAGLRKRPIDLNRLKGAWQAIPRSRLEEYSSALPDEWRSDNAAADKAIRYLTEVRTNLDAALNEVVRILQ